MCHLGFVALGDFALHHKLDYTYHNNSIMAYVMILSMTIKVFISYIQVNCINTLFFFVSNWQCILLLGPCPSLQIPIIV